MKLKVLLVSFLFCHTLLIGQNMPEDVVMLNDSAAKYDVYPKLYWFEDAEGKLQFEAVRDSTFGSRFALNKQKDVPNLGFTNSSFWFKLKVKNNTHARKVILEIPYPFLNRLEVYVPDYRGAYQYKLVGDHFPFSQREIIHKNFLFEIEFWGNEQKTIYAHIRCDGEATSFPITVLKTLELAQRDYKEQITLGVYYGILLFAVFLSLFLGASLREKLNFYYLLYIISIGIFQLSLDGLAFQYLWPNNTWLANHIIPLAGSSAVLFLLIFSKQLLDAKKYAPLLNKILSGIAWLDLVLLVVSLFPNPFYALSLKSLNFVALFANLMVLITAIYVYKKEYAPARYFLVAFSLLILGVLTALLKNFGFLPRVFITEYGIQIGSAIEIIFLSFALAERVKTLKEEKQLVQELLVDQLRENNKTQKELNIELEKKVRERTLEIEEQNRIIEDKNKDITDSINYAKRIQQAILPPEHIEFIGAENMFIYFKPRDIVSGDFYWYAEKNNKIVIAAVDCTGHGVPGAFMSMIGSTLLHKVVNDLGTTIPSQILRQMDINILEALKQKGELNSNRDGMDMAVCTLDKVTKTVVFSGASRPLYLVRNGELFDYQSSTFSIGGYLEGKEKIFDDETIHVEKGDMIYLFSDGYADQFGGEKNKKFMSKNLRFLFTEIAILPVQIQKQKVHDNLVNWMGKEKQIDDVLVIGIRF
jgi:serine phosphatase RsbU (regulator of sigma subunit)